MLGCLGTAVALGGALVAVACATVAVAGAAVGGTGVGVGAGAHPSTALTQSANATSAKIRTTAFVVSCLFNCPSRSNSYLTTNGKYTLTPPALSQKPPFSVYVPPLIAPES